MAVIETWRRRDLNSLTQIEYLQGNLFSQDAAGNLIGVELYSGGEAYSGGGSVSANVIRADGGTVAVTGSISGNKASVTLPAACYAVVGPIIIVVKLTVGSVITTIGAFASSVYASTTGATVDPGTLVTSVQTLITNLAAATASFADYSGLLAMIAPTYSTSGKYAVGDYVLYNNGLYRCISAITSGESWTAAHWTAVNVGGEVSDLKSALTFDEEKIYETGTAKTATATSIGWKLNSNKNGLCSADADYKLVKYAVTAGNIVKVETDGIFQFQTIETVYTYGTPSRIGDTYNPGVYIFEVPATATFLIVSVLKDSGISNVYDAEDKIDKNAKDIVNVKRTVDDINIGIGILKEYEQFITNTSKKYIDSSGVISDVDNSGFKVTQYIDVDGYINVFFSASASISNYMCAFYDENKGFISGLHGTGAAATNQTTAIPHNAKYVVLAGDGNGGTKCSLVKWIYPVATIIDNDFDETWQMLIGTKSVAYIRSTGKITSTTGAYRVLEASVSEGDSLKINAYAGIYSYYFAFYDNNDDFLIGYQNNSGSSGTISDYEAIVPTGAVKIAIGGNTNYSPTPSGKKLLGVYPTGVLKWKGKKWVCFGDSLTAVNSRTDKHYFDYVAESTGITVVNKGVSGSGYRNQAGVSGAFYQKVSECPTDADVVTIFGSFNDGITDLGTATDTGTTTVGGCINTTIDNLYAVFPTVQLGIVSPTPWVGANPYNHSEYNVYVDLLEEICKKRSIPFLNLYYESNLRPWDSTFRSLAYTKDDGNGVHPDETGHKIISSRFLGFLDSLIV